MSKYDALGPYLRKQNKDHVPMTFAEIERVIGTPLPASAHKHRPWWSNNETNSVLTKVWLEAGYKSEQVDMTGQRLVFRRAGKRPATPAESASSIDSGHPLIGALKGLLRVAEETDLTKPADPEWGAR